MSMAEKSILTLQDMSAVSVPLEQIMEAVCKTLRVGRRDVAGPYRFRDIAEARHIFYWFARVYTHRSFPEIARFINRDHATVMHGVRKVDQNLLALMPKLRAVANALNVNLQDRKAA